MISLLLAALALTSTTPAPAPARSKVVATLERGGCFGPCPVYALTVFADGRVVFEGKDHVQVRGKQEAQLTAEELKALRKAFTEARFFKLEHHKSASYTTDLPTVTTSFQDRGQSRRIAHDHGDAGWPDALTQLENRIDEITNSARWIGGETSNE